MYTPKKTMQNNNYNNQMYTMEQLHMMDGNASPNEKKSSVIKCPQIVCRPFCRLVICCKRIPCMEEIIEPFYCCLWQNYWYYTLCGGLVIRDTSGMTGGSIDIPHCPWSFCSFCDCAFQFLPFDYEERLTNSNDCI
jgi:hypothetical protein